MTDKMKEFLEKVSQDGALTEKLKSARTTEEMIALAAENGFLLTEEDLKPEAPAGELSDDELDAVAGGKACACVLGGGGKAGGDDMLCYCVGSGTGKGEFDKERRPVGIRCFCEVGGGGKSWN